MATVPIPQEIHKQTLISPSDLCAQKNSSFPIFRLPPEILADTFIHAAHDYYEFKGGNLRVPEWVGVSYVCRHWRHVALSCPVLWTYLFTVSLRWTEESLARSRDASLKIRISHRWAKPESWWSDLVEMVLSHVDRIQELHLSVPDRVLPEEISLRAPRLQILDIHGTNPSAIKYVDIAPLHTLRLNNCSLPWHSTLNLSGITTLFLRCIPPRSQQNMTDFLVTLSCMQALTVLLLDRALPSARSLLSSGAPCVSRKVDLPFLTRLGVLAQLPTVIALLSCMNIPFKTQLVLEIEQRDSSFDSFSQLTSVLAPRFSQYEDLSFSSPAISSLVLDFSHNSTFIFNASERGVRNPNLSTTYPTLLGDAGAFVDIFHGIRPPSPIGKMEEIVSSICCWLPSTHIQNLHVINPPPSTHKFLGETLGHLNGLRYMKLSSGYMPDLSLALPVDAPEEDPRRYVTGDRDPTWRHTFLPALEELEPHQITFACEDDSFRGITQKSLLDAVSTRKALRLTMTECDVEEKKVPDE